MNKKIVWLSVGSVVAGFSVVSLMNFFYRGNANILHLLKMVSPMDYLIAFLIFSTVYLVEGFRLWVLLHVENYRTSFLDSMLNNTGGYLMAYLTPSGTGGQPYQIYHMTKLGVDSGYATSLMAARFVEITFGNAVVALLTLHSSMKWILSRGHMVFAGIFVNVSLAVLVLFAITRPQIIFPTVKFLSKILKKEEWPDQFLSWSERLKSSTRKLWSKHIVYMFLDILGWFVVTSLIIAPLYFILSKLLGNFVDFWRFFGAVVTVNSLAYFIPTPGASGGVETVYQLVLSPLAGDATKTLSAVFAWRMVSYYLQIPFAASIILAFRGRNSKRIQD